MRTSARLLVSAAAILTLGLSLALLLIAKPRALPAAAPVASGKAPLDFRFAWPRGTTYVYDLTWTLEQTTRLGEAPVTGRVALAGTIEWRSYGEAGGSTLLGVRFPTLARAEVRLGGQPLLGDDAQAMAALVGPEAFVEVAPTGLVRALYVAPDAPELFSQLVQNLVGDAEVVVPSERVAEWTAAAHPPAGTAEVHYQAHPGPAPALDRRTLRYRSLSLLPGGQGDDARQELGSAGHIVLAPAGHLASLAQDERLSVRGDDGAALATSHDRLALELRSVGTFDPGAGPTLSRLSRRLLGEVVASEAGERRLLEARAEGMTGAQLLDDLATQVAAGRMLEHSRWMWRAVAVLRLHPELCAELVPLFQDAATGIAGRALLLDLLASTGHPEAQTAMRAMLASAIATEDPRYGQLLQRTSVLDQPDAATVGFVRDVYVHANERGDAELAHAAAYAYGATGGKRPGAEGARVSAELHAGLAHAGSGSERAVFVMALGNSGRDEDLATIRAHLADPDAQVRRAAVDATRGRAAEVVDDLIARLGDPDLAVQREALAILARAPLADAALDRIAEVVLSGALRREADDVLLALLSQALRPSPAVARMLRFVLARQGDHPDLATRARALLARIGAGT